jgi:hypothetical protein
MTRKLSDPIGRMQKGPTGTRRMEKGPSRDFYEELQASSDTQVVVTRRSDGDGERSHRYT